MITSILATLSILFIGAIFATVIGVCIHLMTAHKIKSK